MLQRLLEKEVRSSCRTASGSGCVRHAWRIRQHTSVGEGGAFQLPHSIRQRLRAPRLAHTSAYVSWRRRCVPAAAQHPAAAACAMPGAYVSIRQLEKEVRSSCRTASGSGCVRHAWRIRQHTSAYVRAAAHPAAAACATKRQ
jgi:hypothetical protein